MIKMAADDEDRRRRRRRVPDSDETTSDQELFRSITGSTFNPDLDDFFEPVGSGISPDLDDFFNTKDEEPPQRERQYNIIDKNIIDKRPVTFGDLDKSGLLDTLRRIEEKEYTLPSREKRLGFLRTVAKGIIGGIVAMTLGLTAVYFISERERSNPVEAVLPMSDYIAVTVSQYASLKKGFAGSRIKMTGAPVAVSLSGGTNLAVIIEEDGVQARCSTFSQSERASLYSLDQNPALAAYAKLQSIVEENKDSFPKKNVTVYGWAVGGGEFFLEGVKISPTEDYRIMEAGK